MNRICSLIIQLPSTSWKKDQVQTLTNSFCFFGPVYTVLIWSNSPATIFFFFPLMIYGLDLTFSWDDTWLHQLDTMVIAWSFNVSLYIQILRNSGAIRVLKYLYNTNYNIKYCIVKYNLAWGRIRRRRLARVSRHRPCCHTRRAQGRRCWICLQVHPQVLSDECVNVPWDPDHAPRTSQITLMYQRTSFSTATPRTPLSSSSVLSTLSSTWSLYFFR